MGSLLLPLQVYAQEMDTLQGVNIKAQQHSDSIKNIKARYTTASKQQVFNKQVLALYPNKSLNDLLQNESNVSIKSFGVNGAATLNIRGSSAAQNSILWNGVPINNPAIGATDISIIPISLFEQIDLAIGSNSSIYGSGSVGGVVLLQQFQPTFTPQYQLQVRAGAGSFGQYHGGGNFAYENKRWSFAWNSNVQSAENNFQYQTPQGTTQRMTNAQNSSWATIGQVAYNLSKTTNEKHYLSAQIWLQENKRALPPALFETHSDKQQEDESLRSQINWVLQRKNSEWNYKLAFSTDQMRYNDPSLNTHNRYQTQQYYQEFNWNIQQLFPKAKHNKHSLLVSIPVLHQQMHYSQGKPTQTRPAIHVNYALQNKYIQASAGLRKEWNQQHNIPWIPSVQAVIPLLQMPVHVALKASVQKAYRVPTLNELYYFPGGNDQLKPENGWNKEAGYALQWKTSGLSIEQHTYYFDRKINDWIYWLGGAIWTPHNLAKVHSRGLDMGLQVQCKWRNTQSLKLHTNYTYTLATTEASYMPNDKSIGKQIPYTPKYLIQNTLSYQYLGWTGIVNVMYTGYRYTTTDESQYLAPYTLTNLRLGYSYQKGKHRWQALLGIENLWNSRYQVVNARPMPGRGFQFTLIYTQNKQG